MFGVRERLTSDRCFSDQTLLMGVFFVFLGLSDRFEVFGFAVPLFFPHPFLETRLSLVGYSP